MREYLRASMSVEEVWGGGLGLEVLEDAIMEGGVNMEGGSSLHLPCSA